MNEVAMLIRIPVVGGAKGNAGWWDSVRAIDYYIASVWYDSNVAYVVESVARQFKCVWFDSMPDYIEIWLLYQFKKGASMGRTTHSTKVHNG